MRDDLDRFYTNSVTVDFVLEQLSLQDFDVIVEPSAGRGAFSQKIPGCLAFDIAPQNSNIVEKNWLNVTIHDIPTFENLLIIGNPPFGVRSVLAKKFIEHSIYLGASTIAFILPSTFNKFTNQRMFDNTWRLVVSKDIPDKNFIMPDNKTTYIPCSLFIWTKNNDYLSGINLRDVKVKQPLEYSYLRRDDNTADFVVNGNNGKVKDIVNVSNSKAEHYIKVNDGYDVNLVRSIFEKLNYDFVSSVSGGVAWINRDDINKIFTSYLNSSISE